MPKIDRIGCTYMQHVAPSPGAPREGKGASVEIRSYALRNSPPPRQPRSPVSLQVQLESLREGRETMTSAGVMSGSSSRRSWGPCTCAHPGPPGSPDSAQHSTSGIYTHIWSSGWHGTCHSLSHNTWLHSCPCLGKSSCTRGLLYPESLKDKPERHGWQCLGRIQESGQQSHEVPP